MLYCSERVFYTAWGEKRKKKKQTKTATQAKDIQGRI